MRKPALALVFLFLLLYLAPLGLRPIQVPDESRYGEIAREMLAGGDWTVPRLCGIRYFEKPVLGYWLNGASISLFGRNGFAIRLPSALATGLTALLVYFVARRGGRDRGTALFASGIFLTCAEVFAVGGANILDAVFSLFVAAALAAFAAAHGERVRARRLAYLFACGAACGLAFLTKGFIALAVPAAVVAPFLIWERRWRDLLTVPGPIVAGCLLVALPWSVAVHLREPQYWHYFFFVEHVQRFFAAGSAQHVKPAWFYLPVLIGGAIPWTFAAPAAAIGLRREPRRDSTLRFAWCWALLPFLFFSLSKGKIATYLLPCFPGIAILLAIGLASYLRSGQRRALGAGAAALAVLLASGAVFLVADRILPSRAPGVYGLDETGRFAVMVAAFAVAAALAVAAVRAADGRRRVALMGLAPSVVLVCVGAAVPAKVTAERMPEAFLEAQRAHVTPDTILMAESHLAPAVSFQFDRADVAILGGTGEFDWGLAYPDSADRGISIDDLVRRVRDPGRTRPLALVTYQSMYSEFRDRLPAPGYESSNGALVIARFP